MRKYIIGVLIGCCLSFSVGVHAEVLNMIGKQVESVFDLTINNQKMEYQAVLIDGTTYAPVRMLGEATGHIVRFDSDSGVKLIKKIITPKLTIMKSIDGINSSIKTTQRMILAKEVAIEELKNGPQNDITLSDIKNAENSIKRWKSDILNLQEQIDKLNQTIIDIDAQETEIANQ